MFEVGDIILVECERPTVVSFEEIIELRPQNLHKTRVLYDAWKENGNLYKVEKYGDVVRTLNKYHRILKKCTKEEVEVYLILAE